MEIRACKAPLIRCMLYTKSYNESPPSKREADFFNNPYDENRHNNSTSGDV